MMKGFPLCKHLQIYHHSVLRECVCVNNSDIILMAVLSVSTVTEM